MLQRAQTIKIELRSVEHIERCSEETNCYAAKVFIDGKHVADVSNEGHGGCDHQRPARGKTQADLAALDALIGATFPRMTYDGEDLGPATLESVCGDLLTEWLISRDLTRLMNRAIVFVALGMPGLRTVSLKQKRHKFTVAEVGLFVRRKYVGAQVLNTMPFDAAMELYRKHG